MFVIIIDFEKLDILECVYVYRIIDGIIFVFGILMVIYMNFNLVFENYNFLRGMNGVELIVDNNLYNLVFDYYLVDLLLYNFVYWIVYLIYFLLFVVVFYFWFVYKYVMKVIRKNKGDDELKGKIRKL